MLQRQEPRPRRDPAGLLRQVTSEIDRIFSDTNWPSLRWTARPHAPAGVSWSPEIDVFEKDGRLITKVDLPGLKKEDVHVEIADGHLVITGERKSELEEQKDNLYRCERAYGSFYRAVPLPDGVTPEEVHAAFADGVLEVSVPLPAASAREPRRVEIQDGTGKAAAV